MKKTLFAIALAAVLPLSAAAAERSYTFVEGTFSNLGRNFDGLGVRGSIQFADTGFYALGQYQSFSGRGRDTDFWELGFGYAMNLSSQLDLITEVAHTDFDLVDGHRVSVGVRNSFTRNLEGLAKVNYRDVDAFGSDFTYTAGLLFNFNPTWGITGEIEFDRDRGRGRSEAYTLGLRASF